MAGHHLSAGSPLIHAPERVPPGVKPPKSRKVLGRMIEASEIEKQLSNG